MIRTYVRRCPTVEGPAGQLAHASLTGALRGRFDERRGHDGEVARVPLEGAARALRWRGAPGRILRLEIKRSWRAKRKKREPHVWGMSPSHAALTFARLAVGARGADGSQTVLLEHGRGERPDHGAALVNGNEAEVHVVVVGGRGRVVLREDRAEDAATVLLNGLAARGGDGKTTAHAGQFFAGKLFADFQVFDKHFSSPKKSDSKKGFGLG